MIISKPLMDMLKTLYVLKLFDYEDIVGKELDFFIETMKIWNNTDD